MIKFTNNADSATIQIMGDIGNSFWGDGWTLERFTNQLKGLNVSNILVEMQSPGGDLMEGFAIHDALRNMAARVTVRVVGSSASAATVIAAGADRVEITENSRYLVHNAQTFVGGNKEAIGEVYEQLESFDNQILDIYVKRTGKPRNELAELMKQEKWMTASEALEWGFVDEIIKPKINNLKIDNVMTPEEIAALEAENEQLKAQVADLQSQLDALLEEQQAAEAEAVETEVAAAIESGKIDASAKDHWVNFGKSNHAAMTAAIESIKMVAAKSLNDNEEKPEEKLYANSAEVWADFKSGKLNYEKAQAELTNLKNK